MTTRDLTLVALFAAIMVALAFIPAVPIGAVPITLQSMGPMLAGCIIGAKRGALAMALVVLLLAVGFPVVASPGAGLPKLAGPTGGFIFGWIAAAFVTGYLAERLVRQEQPKWHQIGKFFVASIIGGIVILYAFGMPQWSIVAGTPFSVVAYTSLVFIPGDLIKAAATAFVAWRVLQDYPLLPNRA